jgi:hypothetical protein
LLLFLLVLFLLVWRFALGLVSFFMQETCLKFLSRLALWPLFVLLCKVFYEARRSSSSSSILSVPSTVVASESEEHLPSQRRTESASQPAVAALVLDDALVPDDRWVLFLFLSLLFTIAFWFDRHCSFP